jgi:hypothetical protein
MCKKSARLMYCLSGSNDFFLILLVWLGIENVFNLFWAAPVCSWAECCTGRKLRLCWLWGHLHRRGQHFVVLQSNSNWRMRLHSSLQLRSGTENKNWNPLPDIWKKILFWIVNPFLEMFVTNRHQDKSNY